VDRFQLEDCKEISSSNLTFLLYSVICLKWKKTIKIVVFLKPHMITNDFLFDLYMRFTDMLLNIKLRVECSSFLDKIAHFKIQQDGTIILEASSHVLTKLQFPYLTKCHNHRLPLSVNQE
jgi:hypothetical protein